MKKIFIILILSIITISLQAKTKLKDNPVPKDIVVISQSSEAHTTKITAVDLSNNELVILHIYNTNIMMCYRTGIKVDIDKQKAIEGSSVPHGDN